MPFVQPQVQRKLHVIDATGQAPGRLASRIAFLLQGKHKAIYEPQWDMGDSVRVENVAAMHVTEKKAVQKKYFHFSGYPGGMKAKSWGTMMDQSPERVLFLAVYRMLPKNKLRDVQIKRLNITK